LLGAAAAAAAVIMGHGLAATPATRSAAAGCDSHRHGRVRFANAGKFTVAVAHAEADIKAVAFAGNRRLRPLPSRSSFDGSQTRPFRLPEPSSLPGLRFSAETEATNVREFALTCETFGRDGPLMAPVRR
jgi:hypothetical protein